VLVKNRGPFRLLFIWFALCSTLAASDVRVAGGRGAVVGVVCDEVGAFLPGALVTVSGPTSADPQKSGAMGFFRFGDLAPGAYIINISHPDYSSVALRIVIRAGATVDFGVQLRGTRRSSFRWH
jgi:hypothetical protein